MTFQSPNPPDPELTRAIEDRMTRMTARIHARPCPQDDDPSDCCDGYEELCGYADDAYDDEGER